MLIFTIVPLLFVVYFAFTTRDGAFTTENFGKFFRPGNLPVVFDSFRLAFFCTVICLLWAIRRPTFSPRAIFRAGGPSWC